MKAIGRGTETEDRAGGRRGRPLPKGVWVLGLGSMFMDISSELVHSILPIFMAAVLGASMTTIGLVEGVAEATAQIVKVFSGALSDRFAKRKGILVSGYGLSLLTKPIFPLATSMVGVFAARFVDRIGKGIRGAPRDALVADLTPPALRGAAYGLRQSLDSVGAFIGPLLAMIFLAQFADRIRAVLWVAVLPACLAVLILAVALREPERAPAQGKSPRGFTWTGAGRLPSAFWLIVALGVVFTLARFSEAFLVLRASDAGLPLALVPLVMIVMNLVYAASAYPAGVAADHLSVRGLLLAGLLALIASDLALAAASGPAAALAGAGLWGVHMGLTQGLFAKLVADAAPSELRGTAFGIFNLASGVALLLASLIAGVLWSAVGAPAPFLAGAAFAALAAVGLILSKKSRRGGRV